MSKSVDADEFLKLSQPIFDVRSPGEFAQGHIPGAINLPLFDDAERAQVGICYKYQGREAAIELGLTIVGPKLAEFVRTVKPLVPTKALRLHCWRGGMRSSSMAWLLETAGFNAILLSGGYKAFRRWVRSRLSQSRALLIVGGMTGTGKTAVLHVLASQGEQILDLEKLANHRGSSYGNLDAFPQPTTEHFENLIAMTWNQFNDRSVVWVEAESAQIGTCRIPQELFQQMETAPVCELVRSRNERIIHLVNLYGKAKPEQLIQATERIRKRLGGQQMQQAIGYIQQGKLEAAIEVILNYYDKTYHYDLQRRQSPIYTFDVTGLSMVEAAEILHKNSEVAKVSKEKIS